MKSKKGVLSSSKKGERALGVKEVFDPTGSFFATLCPIFKPTKKQMEEMSSLYLRKLAHMLALWQYEISLEFKRRNLE